MSIFKAYDIRGVVPDQLREEDAHRIGGAVARHLGGPILAVGRDARATSPELGDALVRGITEQGVDVVDLGLVATPMLYFAVDRLETAGGVMVTASHNPAQYNGFKVCGPNAVRWVRPLGSATSKSSRGRSRFPPSVWDRCGAKT